MYIDFNIYVTLANNTIMNYREIYSAMADNELVKIVKLERDQFSPEAIKIAEEELEKREHLKSNLNVVLLSVDEQGFKKKEIANAPLGIGFKILAVLLPMVGFLIIMIVFAIQGKKRKMREFFVFTLYGVVLWILLILISR